MNNVFKVSAGVCAGGQGFMSVVSGAPRPSCLTVETKMSLWVMVNLSIITCHRKQLKKR